MRAPQRAAAYVACRKPRWLKPVYDASVFEFLPSLSPSARGELEITDVNNWFVEQGLMEYDVVDGFWGDAGESIDAYYEVNDYVRENGANR